MLSEKMVKAFEYQINREIYSAYFYLGMSSYASSNGFSGIANWFAIQVKEELFHAQKMYDYVIKGGSKVTLQAIEEPPQDFTSVVDLFDRTLKHEKAVTGLINDLVKVAQGENDKDSEKFLEWYVKEQQEEEATPAGILDKLKAAGNNKDELLRVDSELAKRVSPPFFQ